MLGIKRVVEDIIDMIVENWIISFVLLILLCGFLGVSRYMSGHFCLGVNVNGVSAFAMTMEDVENALLNQDKTYILEIVQKNKDQTSFSEFIVGTDIDLVGQYNKEDLEHQLERQKGLGWIGTMIHPVNLQITKTYSYNTSMVNKLVKKLKCMDSDFMQAPVDAHISPYQSGKGFYIVGEENGNTPKPKAVKTVIMDALTQGKSVVNLEEEGCYRHAKIRKKNPDLRRGLKELLPYLDTKITYKFGDKVVEIGADQIGPCLSLDKENHVTVSKDAVRDIVNEMQKTYDTKAHEHSFTTVTGKEIVFSSGQCYYGWWTDAPSETEELLKLIQNKTSGERTPIYHQKAAEYSDRDYGNSYVEVNLTKQHLYLILDGKVVLESDFVSGNASRGWDTPTGFYPINAKQRNATLKGENYSTPVDYWMPFNGNIGFHDAGWRNTFGGELYKTSGSHGCINMPPEKAKQLYEKVWKDMAVVVYRE